MDLSKLFNDDRVEKFKTHIVMKSVGVEAGDQYKGYAIPPKKDKNGNQAFELFAIKNKAAMESLGWVEVKPVPEPTDAKTTRKPKDNVEG
jgi:hypothetical protein